MSGTTTSYMAGLHPGDIEALVARVQPDNEEPVRDYLQAMVAVTDLTEPAGPVDGPEELRCCWLALDHWYGSLDSLHSNTMGFGDPAVEALVAHEAGRLLAARGRLVEAVARHVGCGFFDPQGLIDATGSPLICMSNAIVDTDGGTARLYAAISDEPERPDGPQTPWSWS